MPVMLASALTLFFLRIVDTALSTLRLLMVLRGRKLLAWITAFAGATVYVIGVRQVLVDPSGWASLIGYAAGYSTGMLLGMWIEDRIAIGYTAFRVISPRRGSILMERLREEGFAVTVVSGSGKDGMVDVLLCSVLRRHGGRVEALALETDPEAFIVAQDLRRVKRGYWPS